MASSPRPWTLRERYTLVHLLSNRPYQKCDADWWTIYQGIYGDSPKREDVYDDWAQRNHETRGEMYRREIFRIDGSRHTTGEILESFRAELAILRQARIQGIDLPPNTNPPKRDPLARFAPNISSYAQKDLSASSNTTNEQRNRDLEANTAAANIPAIQEKEHGTASESSQLPLKRKRSDESILWEPLNSEDFPREPFRPFAERKQPKPTPKEEKNADKTSYRARDTEVSKGREQLEGKDGKAEEGTTAQGPAIRDLIKRMVPHNTLDFEEIADRAIDLPHAVDGFTKRAEGARKNESSSNGTSNRPVALQASTNRKQPDASSKLATDADNSTDRFLTSSAFTSRIPVASGKERTPSTSRQQGQRHAATVDEQPPLLHLTSIEGRGSKQDGKDQYDELVRSLKRQKIIGNETGTKTQNRQQQAEGNPKVPQGSSSHARRTSDKGSRRQGDTSFAALIRGRGQTAVESHPEEELSQNKKDANFQQHHAHEDHSSEGREVLNNNDGPPNSAEGSTVSEESDEATRAYYRRRRRYKNWVRRNLINILEGSIEAQPVRNLPPQRGRARKIAVPAQFSAPSSKDRIAAWFYLLFGGRISRETCEQMIDDSPLLHGELLTFIHRSCIGKVGPPDYKFLVSFDAGPAHPFSNFHIVAPIFVECLSMVHYKDVKWKGHQGGQAVIGLEGTFPVESLTFVDENSDIFKRSGRVYSIMIFQPNALGMGSNVMESTAWVKFDAMICDSEYCDTCSPEGPGISSETPSFSGYPRVHARFLASGNRYKEGIIKSPAYHHEEFIEDLNLGEIEVKFYDNHRESAMICQRSSCKGCIEYAGLYKKLE